MPGCAAGARSSSTGGFTLLEMLIVLGLVGAVAGSLVTVLRTSARACEVGMTNARLESAANDALDRIADRLRASGRATIVPTVQSPFSSPRIDYQRSEGIAGGATVWGQVERIAFELRPGELDDGLDNEGNGRADDGRLVWTRDVGAAGESSTVWVDGVSQLLDGETQNGADDNANGLVDERGLCFTVDGASVFVRLTLAARDSAGVVLTRTAEERVFFRNR